jgi:hypothetical protein
MSQFRFYSLLFDGDLRLEGSAEIASPNSRFGALVPNIRSLDQPEADKVSVNLLLFCWQCRDNFRAWRAYPVASFSLGPVKGLIGEVDQCDGCRARVRRTGNTH